MEQTVWLIEVTIKMYRNKGITLEECLERIELFLSGYNQNDKKLSYSYKE